MYCITAILTSQISQALLQAALDKKERDFTGWMLQYEFSSLPVPTVTSREAQRRFMQCQCHDQWQPQWEGIGTGTGLPGWLRQPLQEALAQPEACKI
jgi:hypothetical protein